MIAHSSLLVILLPIARPLPAHTSTLNAAYVTPYATRLPLYLAHTAPFPAYISSRRILVDTSADSFSPETYTSLLRRISSSCLTRNKNGKGGVSRSAGWSTVTTTIHRGPSPAQIIQRTGVAAERECERCRAPPHPCYIAWSCTSATPKACRCWPLSFVSQ